MRAVAVLLVILKAICVLAVLLGGAWALTHYINLPAIADGAIWVAAGAYSLLAIIMYAALVATVMAAARKF